MTQIQAPQDGGQEKKKKKKKPKRSFGDEVAVSKEKRDRRLGRVPTQSPPDCSVASNSSSQRRRSSFARSRSENSISLADNVPNNCHGSAALQHRQHPKPLPSEEKAKTRRSFGDEPGSRTRSKSASRLRSGSLTKDTCRGSNVSLSRRHSQSSLDVDEGQPPDGKPTCDEELRAQELARYSAHIPRIVPTETEPAPSATASAPGVLGALDNVRSWMGRPSDQPVASSAAAALPSKGSTTESPMAQVGEGPLSSDATFKSSAYCREMEEEVMRIKLEIAQARADNETQELRARQLSDEKDRLKNQLENSQQNIRDIYKMTRSLDHELNSIREKHKKVTEDPELNDLKARFARATAERDALREVSYDLQGDNPRKSLLKMRDWIVDDLWTEVTPA